MSGKKLNRIPVEVELVLGGDEEQLSSEESPESEDDEPSAAELHASDRGQKRGQGQRRGPVRHQRWKTERETDIRPRLENFCPKRPPGIQIPADESTTPLELFKRFFNDSTIKTICKNTNKQAARNIAKGRKYRWVDLTPDELLKFFGLLLYMAIVKMPIVSQYWRKNHIFSVAFPKTVMPRDSFRSISWNIYMSNPEDDIKNDQKKGTAEYDPLHRIRPLYDDIRTACKAQFHPRRNLTIDERMVATKSKSDVLQCMKSEPVKCGVKLFVLADSSNRYTVDFSIYTGKSQFSSGHDLPYSSVMTLMNRDYLGTGYHLFCDHFYTSPKLFKDLLALQFRACGTYKDTQKEDDFPTPTIPLAKKSARGSFRWLRNDQLLFVKWLDTREVSICSTIHRVYDGEKVNRRLKDDRGNMRTISIPAPTPVLDYNKYMGGVDLSDQLIQYYSVPYKTTRWYKILLYHFIDIATTNSYILHREIFQAKRLKPLTHLEFMEQLTAELCKTPLDFSQHLSATPKCGPVAIASQFEDRTRRATAGRRKCKLCKKDTPWKCCRCNVALCLILDRNCYQEWHDNSERCSI